MKNENLSVKNLYIVSSILFLTAALFFLTVLILTDKKIISIVISLVFIIFVICFIVSILWIIRKKNEFFTFEVCTILNAMIEGKKIVLHEMEEDSLLAHIKSRFIRCYDIMQENYTYIEKEKKEIQELISDISHQIKTPIANLKLITTTLLKREIPIKEQNDFLKMMETQLDKLDFFMQSMIKSSRLETGMITLSAEQACLTDTITVALGNIFLLAEAKNIEVSYFCDPQLKVWHDKKWTAEAIFNILDNAVKYTPKGGKITITVEKQEMYTKIDISDTGKGIAEKYHCSIFKRFFREEAVSEVEGIGIGLYLAREIIGKQYGYIKVNSSLGCGSVFSIFLLNKMNY